MAKPEQPTPPESTPPGQLAADASVLTRRRFLKTAGGAVVLAGTGVGVGFGVAQLVSAPAAPAPPQAASAAKLHFRSRPDLSPPPIKVLVPARRTAPGLLMLTAARTDRYQNGPMIVDDAGQLVWFHPARQGSTTLAVQRYDGRPVLSWWQGRIVLPGGYGIGECVIVGSDYRPLARVRAGNGLHADLHEFVITPRGTALITVYHPVRRDLSAVGGPRDGTLLDSLFQEVDIKSGKVLMQWSAAAHVALEESHQPLPQQTDAPYDFFHINSIAEDGDGNLLVSGRHTWALYKVGRSSGAVIWRLGGKRSDFAIERAARFEFQHDARPHPGGVITLFDNGAGEYPVEHHSRGLKLGVDFASRRVRLLEQYLPDPLVSASSQGSVQLLDNGNVFVGWGSQPYCSEYGPYGDLRFDAQMLGGSNSYRAFRSAWVGVPATAPKLAVRVLRTRRFVLYASWNGATEVSRWEVIGGERRAALKRSLGSFRRTGFETAMPVNTGLSYLAVRARDAHGRVLARSHVARAPQAGVVRV